MGHMQRLISSKFYLLIPSSVAILCFDQSNSLHSGLKMLPFPQQTILEHKQKETTKIDASSSGEITSKKMTTSTGGGRDLPAKL